MNGIVPCCNIEPYMMIMTCKIMEAHKKGEFVLVIILFLTVVAHFCG